MKRNKRDDVIVSIMLMLGFIAWLSMLYGVWPIW